MTKYIKLTQGKQTIVSEQDYDELSKYKWCYNNGQAVRNANVNNKHTIISMHRQILQVDAKERISHVNGDNLDNRRENLRLVSKAKNTSENVESQVLRLSKNTKTAAQKIRIIMGDKYADELTAELSANTCAP
jgi:hypothetical protein